MGPIAWLRQCVAARSSVIASELPGASPLWFVTVGAQPVPSEVRNESSPIAVQQSPLLGLGRVAALELPDLRPRLLDLDPTVTLQQMDDVGSGHLQ